MSLLESIFLGIVQGLTEFLPVSSSGHLAILQNLLGIETEGGVLFGVLLHLGTLVAIFVAFWNDIRHLFRETCCIFRDLLGNLNIFIQNKRSGSDEAYRTIIHNNYRKFVALVAVATIPTGLLGFFSRHIVEAAGENLLAPGIGLLITGVLLLVVDYTKAGGRIPREATYAHAMWIGICQGFAVFPGISRSGMTIASSLLCGFSRKFAIKFSFLMSIPAVLGAAVLEIAGLGEANISWKLGGVYVVGAVAAGLVGYLAIRFMIVLVQKRKFRYFAYYCFFAGIVSILGNFLIQ